jgi:hypothetical protein
MIYMAKEPWWRMQREPQDKKNSLDESCLSKYNCRRKEDWRDARFQNSRVILILKSKYKYMFEYSFRSKYNY